MNAQATVKIRSEWFRLQSRLAKCGGTENGRPRSYLEHQHLVTADYKAVSSQTRDLMPNPVASAVSLASSEAKKRRLKNCEAKVKEKHNLPNISKMQKSNF